MKEQIIQIPDTLEIKEIKDGKIILVEKEKKLTYEDITRKLFANKNGFFMRQNSIAEVLIPKILSSGNYCTSYKQAEKLCAINMLMNVAKYLNDDWQPNWRDKNEDKWYIRFDYSDNMIYIACNQFLCSNCNYFKSEELAKQAIEILGEDTIRLALCTDY